MRIVSRYGSCLLAALTSAAVLTVAPAASQERVTFGIPHAFLASDGGIFAIAEELNFFKAENLEVNTIVLQGAGNTIPQLLRKNITFAYATQSAVLAAYKPGEDPLPSVIVYNVVPYNHIQFGVLATSGIHKIEELRDSKVGVGALTWGTIPHSRAVLRSAGLEPGKDVNYVAVGGLGSAIHALKEGRVQALNHPIASLDVVEQGGVKLRRFDYPDGLQNIGSIGIVAHRDMISEKPHVIAGFGRAYTKGLIVCDTNPAACVKAFWRRNPQLAPAIEDREKALAEEVASTKKYISRIRYSSDGSERRLGGFDLAGIESFAKGMHKFGEWASDSIPLDRYYTNQFTAQYNEFDRDALVGQAKALH